MTFREAHAQAKIKDGLPPHLIDELFSRLEKNHRKGFILFSNEQIPTRYEETVRQAMEQIILNPIESPAAKAAASVLHTFETMLNGHSN